MQSESIKNQVSSGEVCERLLFYSFDWKEHQSKLSCEDFHMIPQAREDMVTFWMQQDRHELKLVHKCFSLNQIPSLDFTNFGEYLSFLEGNTTITTTTTKIAYSTVGYKVFSFIFSILYTKNGQDNFKSLLGIYKE